MLITLDGKRLPDQDGTALTLQALIDQVRGAFEADRIVAGVRIDGHPLIGEALHERLPKPLGNAIQVDLESADAIQVSKEALRAIADQLGDARDMLQAISQQIQQGTSDDALAGFRGFLGIWRSANTALQECGSLLQRDLMHEEILGQPLVRHVEQLSGKLRELRDAFEARDMVLLSDLVEYEMPEVCQAWQGHFEMLADRLVTGPGVPAAHP